MSFGDHPSDELLRSDDRCDEPDDRMDWLWFALGILIVVLLAVGFYFAVTLQTGLDVIV